MKYQRIRDLREDNDMTQTEIAEKIGTTQSYYAQYERGEVEIPFYRAIQLAEIYGVSLDYIAGRTNNKGGIGDKYRSKYNIKQKGTIINYNK